MNWLKLLQYLPVILQTVVAIESIAKTAPGTAKRQVAVDIVSTGAKIAEGAPSVTVEQIGALVDSVVTSLNTAGVFTPAPLKV